MGGAERLIRTIAAALAVLGGIVLVAISLMVVVSITGRAFLWAGLRPVPGDVEIVESSIAFVIAAFMPWCQLEKGHASVGIITDQFSPKVNAVIDLIGDLLLLGAAAVMTWRHIYGLMDKIAYGETTFILRFPLWWGYAGVLVGLIGWMLVGAWCVFADGRAIATGKPRSVTTGAMH